MKFLIKEGGPYKQWILVNYIAKPSRIGRATVWLNKGEIPTPISYKRTKKHWFFRRDLGHKFYVITMIPVDKIKVIQ